MGLGSAAWLGEVAKAGSRGALTEALTERSRNLGEAFRRIVFAQVRISALNTTLTARSRDNLPNPKQDRDGDLDDYVPRNMPAIGDLFDMFNFDRDDDDHGHDR